MSQNIPAQRVSSSGGLPLEHAAALRAALAREVEKSVRRLRLLGVGWGVIAAQLGAPKATVYRQYKHVDGWPIGVVMSDRGARFECLETGVTWRDPEDLRLTPAERLVLGDYAQAREAAADAPRRAVTS